MAQNKFTEAVAKIQGLPLTQHKVLKVIAQFTDNQTGECFPSMSTISTGADVARSTVQLAVDGLLKAGYLQIVGKRPTKHGSVNVYRVVPNPGSNDTDQVVPILNRTYTDQPFLPTGKSVSIGLNENPQAQSVTACRTDTFNHTDRYRTDQVVSSSPVDRRGKSNPNPLIGTDADVYVKRIVDRFARYKQPGRDAEVFAKEILLSNGFAGGSPLDEYSDHVECTLGENATRHIIDLIGWVFEINAYEEGERVFRWAERTYTMKNLRDHVLKDKSKLVEGWTHFCCDFDGYKHGNRGAVAYALSTIGDSEFVGYAEAAKARRLKRNANA